MTVKISLDNAKIINGEIVGGFHETHKFRNLHNMEDLSHAINRTMRANFNNYGETHVLIHALIECDDAKIVDEFNAKLKEMFCSAYCKKITMSYSPFDIWTD